MDIDLSYTKKGKGQDLILLHGNGEESSYFENQIDEFAKYYTVWAVDTRGHGKSARGEGEFNLKVLADDLYDFMKLNEIKKAHILGYSDGGNIALIFALEHQNMIDKLILNGANIKQNGIKTYYNICMMTQYILLKGLALISSNSKKKAEIMSLMINQPNISEDDLQKIKVSTLVVVGTKDVIKQNHTNKIYKYIKSSELSIINGTHAVASENPKQFNKIVLDFLNK